MTERTSYLPGTPSWIDLGSPDTGASAAFYGGLLGWTAEIDPRLEAGGYGIFTLRGKRVAGLGPQMNLDMPLFWALYVSPCRCRHQEDCDASAAQAVELGGSILMPPTDMDFGRGAVVVDPHGAVIGIGVMSAAIQATAPA